MAERDLTAAVLAAIGRGHVKPALFTEAEFVSEGVTQTLRLFSGQGTLTWGGHTWTGDGSLLSISPMEESNEVKAVGFELTMAGLRSADIARALASFRRNSPARVYLGFFEPQILDLRFTDGTLEPRIGAGLAVPTFTRASTATYFDASGVRQTAASGEARFDHDPVTGSPRGVLLEVSRTNLQTYSDDLTNAIWTKSHVSTTAGAITASAGSADHYAYGSAPGATSGHTYTVSFVIKKDNYRYIGVGDRSDPSWHFAAIDLDAGAVTLATNCTATVEADEAGAWRVAVTYARTNGGSIQPTVAFLASATDAAPGTFTAAGTERVLVSHAQVEEGPFPTSYIPTTSASVTRNADVLTYTLTDWFNATEGTFVAHGHLNVEPVTGVSNCILFNIGTGVDYMVGRAVNSGDLANFQVGAGSVVADLTPGTAFTAGDTIALVGAYAASNFAATANGSAVSLDTAGAVPTIAADLTVGSDGGQWMNGHISRITYYPLRLPDEQLRALSTTTPYEPTFGRDRLIADPYPLKRGLFDVPVIKRSGETSTITAKYESRLLTLEKPREFRYTTESQRALYPDVDDQGFANTERLQDAQFVWGR